MLRKSISQMVIVAFALFCAMALEAQTYNWKQVVIKGGGYVPGLVYSKADPTLLYARTDVGGAYRWNAANKTWIPITDGLTDANDWGVRSIAPDPVNADRVYIATGLYSESWGAFGVIYRSNDRGASWDTLATLPIKLGGNNPGRGTCEHLMVDPNKNTILFLGSKKDGLYKSVDGGANWTKVSGLNASYITFVEFDKTSGTTGNATPTIYAGVADYIYNNGIVGVYKSTDGGTTWNKLTNHPTALAPKTFAPGDAALTTVPTKMVFTSGNTIYFTFCNTVTPDGENGLSDPHKTISNGAVYKYDKSNNAWTVITPSGQQGNQGGFSTIAVHPTDANKLVVATIGRWWPHDEVFFSADGGANWTSTFNSYSYASTWGSSLNKGSLSYTKAPWGVVGGTGWPNSVVFNPKNGNEVMFGTGGGVYACYDVSGLLTNAISSNSVSTTWVYENDGLEETCAIEMVSPPSGASLISAIGDVDGFVHSNLDASPATRHKTNGKEVGTTRSIDFAENVPTKLVKAHDDNAANKGALSTDGGATWTEFAARPSGIGDNDECGKIAISANGNTIVWAPKSGLIAYSTNNGGAWTNCTGGVPNGLKPISDRVNSSKFYAFDPSAQNFYYSTDGGKNFSSKSLGLTNIPNYEGMQPQLCAVFGKEGHLFLADKINGLHRTKDGGATFTKISTVTTAYRVTVGKAAPTGSYPAIFIYGIINSVTGLFRSDDEGASWERINDATHEYARNHEFLCGDPRVYGRVYDAIGGRGIVYGDKIATTTPVVTVTLTAGAASVCAGAAISLLATTTVSNGTITKVDFYDGTILLGTATTAPYTYNWTTASVGVHSVTAKVTDNANAVTVSKVFTQTVNAIPAAPTVNSPVNLCLNSPAPPLYATGTALQWYTLMTGGIPITPAIIPNTAYPSITPYYVTQTVNACESPRALIRVIVNLLPVLTPSVQVDAGVFATATDTTVVEGQTVVLKPQTPAAGNWAWTGVGSFAATSQQVSFQSITPASAGSYTVVFKDINGCMAVLTQKITVLAKQTIDLAAGWNLISTTIVPKDNSIAAVFKNLDVQEVKTMDAFWRKGQDAAFNGVKTFDSWSGYLVYMNTKATLTLVGTTNYLAGNIPWIIADGWSLMACPYPSSRAFSNIFNETNCSAIKNFEGFWKPNDGTSSIFDLETGKAYFIKK